jgi:hypothetical protein
MSASNVDIHLQEDRIVEMTEGMSYLQIGILISRLNVIMRTRRNEHIAAETREIMIAMFGQYDRPRPTVGTLAPGGARRRPVVERPPPAGRVTKTISKAEFDGFCAEDCAVCMTNVKKGDTLTTNCNHSFCKGCLNRWMRPSSNGNRKCPACRSDVFRITKYIKSRAKGVTHVPDAVIV